MSMPQAVRQHRHYRNEREFERDEAQMRDEGWRAVRAEVRREPRSLLRRMLRLRPRSSVDVAYGRDTWPVP